MKVRLVTDYAAFGALQPAWDRLHARCPAADVFLSHTWFDAAWQWKREHASLHVLCCERDDGELAGVLPLVLCRAADTPLQRHSLEFLCIPDTQRCDALAAPDDRDAVIRTLADELACSAGGWDVARLRQLPPDALALGMLAPALAQRRFRCHASAVASNPWIALDSGWERYYASRSRRLKKAINLAANRLAKAGRVDISWLAPGTGEPADVDRAVDAITRISARSWKTRTGNSLDNPGPQAFIRRLAQQAHLHGWLSIWTLCLDAEPIAMEFQLAHDGNVYALRSDFDASADELSPGSHLSRCLLETLFSRGFTRYFMGPGDNAYKYRWAEGTQSVHALTAYGRSLRSRALAAWELSLKPVARRVRDAIRARRTASLGAAAGGVIEK